MEHFLPAYSAGLRRSSSHFRPTFKGPDGKFEKSRELEQVANYWPPELWRAVPRLNQKRRGQIEMTSNKPSVSEGQLSRIYASCVTTHSSISDTTNCREQITTLNSREKETCRVERH